MRKSATLRGALAAFLLLLVLLAVSGPAALAGETSLFLTGDPGDYVVGNQQLQFTADNSFTVLRNSVNGVSVSFHTPVFSHWWYIDLAAPYGQLLTAGAYPGAKRFPFQRAGDPGFSLDGDGRGCNELTATFQIKQIVYGAGNTIDAFWATFEQHCEGAGPATYGEIRFNADLTADSVLVAAPLNVSVARANALSFDVSATTGDGQPITLSATGLPDGATFVDNGDSTGLFTWTPTFNQSGQYTVNFLGQKTDGVSDTAISVITVTGPTSLSLIGQAGDYIVAGQKLFFTPADGFFTVQKNFDNGVSIHFDLSQSWWDLDFAAPNNQPLTGGFYNAATRFPFQSASAPGLSLSGDGRGCNTLTGSFEVKQIVYGIGNTIDKFWATFEQHCEGFMAPDFGQILFNADVAILSVLKSGSGSGTVTAATGVSCGATCSGAYEIGSFVEFTAVPAEDSVFDGWSGDADCLDGQLTMDTDKSCTALFRRIKFNITVNKSGGGTGAITSNPAGIDCGSVCSMTAAVGSSIMLTATAADGSVFTGWSGGNCSGTATCVVDSDANVIANFDRSRFLVYIIKAGSGDGTVTSSPAGINCAPVCAMIVDKGAVITFTATPAEGSVFSQWFSGIACATGYGTCNACSGTGSCTVTVTSDIQVSPSFAALRNLAVAKTGSGTGTVTAPPTSIDCGNNCSALVPSGTEVTFTATPAPDSVFSGWVGGNCPAICKLTIQFDSTMTAVFTQAKFELTVSKTGTGSGTVTSSPPGINCGTTCSVKLSGNITLTATPAADSLFAGWSGGQCSSSPTCTFNLSSDTNVTASFSPKTYTLFFGNVGSGPGTVKVLPMGVTCTVRWCETSVDNGAMVTLTALPASNSAMEGWEGADCTGTGDCTVTVNSNMAIAAHINQTSFTILIQKFGDGVGTITSSPPGIDCGNVCSMTINKGTSVTLTAVPGEGSYLYSWPLHCDIMTSTTCTFTPEFDTYVQAAFRLKTFTMSVASTGTGTGVINSPIGINCGNDCSKTVSYGTPVTLNAQPSANSMFTGWSGGGCSGTGACTVTMNADTTVTATFTLKPFDIAVTKIGPGSGAVSSSDGKIDCGQNCSATASIGNTVTLTASPSPDSTFLAWGGPCILVVTNTCTFTVNANVSVSVFFDRKMFTLLATPQGVFTTVPGSVTSSPPGINCGQDCSETVAAGSTFVLTANTPEDLVFTGWSGGGCSGTGNCTVTLNANTTVHANFDYKMVRLSVVKTGSGTGVVSSPSIFFNCGATCSGTTLYGRTVTLTAVASADSAFTGWSGGGCSGTGSCTVTMNADTNVTATFVLKTYNLSVSKAGAGTGGVTSSPAGINCGSSCGLTLNTGTSLNLMATPSADSIFTGWSGGCAGTGACVLTMASDIAVTASFALKAFTLSAAVAGSGSGSISSSPLGISCGADCSEVFSIGTPVNLTAAPAADSVFTGWAGACGGPGACNVTMNSDAAVAANFTKRLVLTSPNGGELWMKGTNQTITWNSTGVAGKVKVDYSGDGGATWTNIISPTGNDGAQKWKVNKPATNLGRVRVCTATAPLVCDVSNANFTIQ